MAGWSYFSAILVMVAAWNVFFRYRTYHSLEEDIKKSSWKDAPLNEYIQKCYNLISDRYPMLRHCWVKRFWRSTFYRNLWKISGKSLPCHMYNILFNKCMSLRLPKKYIRLRYVSDFKQLVFVHYYSQLKLDGKWIDVDVWGKFRGVPFGETINSLGWKR